MLAKCKRNLVNGHKRTQQNNVEISIACSVTNYGYESLTIMSTPTRDVKRLE